MNTSTRILSKQISGRDASGPGEQLPLTGIRTTGAEYGYLLRHYWIPATRLEYRVDDVRQGGLRTSRTVLLDMLRCDADGVSWREREMNEHDNSVSETIRLYDRTRQALYRFGDTGEDMAVARNRAFELLPILPPLMPIPVGFRWHVANGEDAMDFLLESVQKVGEMTVLFIRREGRFISGGADRQRIERRGLTAYALERSAVLEDRTHDRVVAGPDVGTESRTTRKLLRSSLPPDRPDRAPLYVKYRTKNHPYIYDCGTGRILETNEAVYELIDDYRIRSPEEVVAGRPQRNRDKVRQTFEHLDSLAWSGYLASHEPTEASPLEIVRYKNAYHRVEDFWMRNGSLLVLGITERCNLDCSYCCYSGKFSEHRSHGNRVMSLDTAKKAIAAFLDQDLARAGKYPITFYGGEPLLEFHHHVRECARFAVEYAAALGKQVRFSLTTNGTLLDDEVADFLVEYDFLILTSFDGLKECHDRYRVFPNGAGSFDVVLENLRRFARRYPDYKKRGVNVTLAPPLHLEETARFVDELAPDYPIIRAAIVNTGAEYRFSGDMPAATRYGCSSCSACESDGRAGTESFRRFEPDDAAQLKTLWNETVERIVRHGLAESRERFPLATALFGGQIGALHERHVLPYPPEWVFMVPCIPGFTRRFVDVDGNYRICERVDRSAASILGNVHDGLDPRALGRVLEMRRHFGDCGNCTALKSCDLCYARIPGTDAASSGYDAGFESDCVRTRHRMEELLPVYTGIMERNPSAFEQPVSGENTLEPASLLRFGSPGSRLDDSVLKRLESETF